MKKGSPSRRVNNESSLLRETIEFVFNLVKPFYVSCIHVLGAGVL